MRTAALLTFLLVLTLGMTTVSAQDEPEADTERLSLLVPDTEIFTLTSTTNGHDYRISVALPPDYGDSEGGYPVL